MNHRTSTLALALFFSAAPLSWAVETQDYRDAGMALYRAGLYTKALDYFQKAVKADPSDWKAYEDLGDTYAKMDDLSSAREAYGKSLKIHPDNPTLRVLVEKLGGSGKIAPPPSSFVSENEGDVSEPPTLPTATPAPKQFEEVNPVTQKAEPWHEHPGAVSATTTGGGGLHRMNHSRFWIKGELGYTYSRQDDFINGANAYNSQITSNNWTGTTTASNHGLNVGGEIGFLINPYNGIAIGTRVLRGSDYHLDVNYEPGLTQPDFQNEILEPWVVPITLDYYLFLPDATGRFFLSAGVGYYRGTVKVYDDYDLIDNGGNADTINGELTSGNIGFQVGFGREWALSNKWGISVYGRARYVKISNFTGILYNTSGLSGTFGLETSTIDGIMDIDNTYNISAGNSEKYATLDFTGFDVGLALTWYSF